MKVTIRYLEVRGDAVFDEFSAGRAKSTLKPVGLDLNIGIVCLFVLLKKSRD